MSSSLFGILTVGDEQRALWPLDRKAHPFSCRPFFGGKTLFEAAWERMLTVVQPDRMRIVCPPQVVQVVAEILPESWHGLIVPKTGGSLAQIYAVSEEIARIQPDSQIVTCPAGMIAGDDLAFSDLVHDAARLAHATGCVVTGTVAVSEIRAGYDCILPGDACIRSGHVVGRDVRRFFPSCSRSEAEAAADRGGLWMTGIHLWNTATFLVDALTVLSETSQGADEPDIPSGFLSRIRNWLLVPSSLVWDPLRSYEDLARYIRTDSQANCRIGPGLVNETRDCIVLSDAPDGMILVSGLKNMLVVQSGDTVLCCQRGDEEKVREALRRFSSADENLARLLE